MHQLTKNIGGDSREDGSALAGVMILSVLASGLVYATATISSVELRDARLGLSRVQALSLAQAGVERGIHQMKDAITKTAVFDPLFGVKGLFGGGPTFTTYKPFTREEVFDGNVKIGEFSVTMNAVTRGEGLDVTINATGYTTEANGPATRTQSRSIEAVVRVSTEPSKVFDHSYFVNNWGWFYGNSIYCNGNAASNGQFDAGGYTPTITGTPTYDKLAWNGSNADLQGYQDDNNDGLQDGNDGGLFSGWDIVGASSVQGNGGQSQNQHDFQAPIQMPNLSDLTMYETKAVAEGAQITIGGTVMSNAVYGDEGGEKQNLYLIGTPADPIVITGNVVVRGDVIVAGVVQGKGSIFSGGNVYVPNDLTYADAPSTSRPANNTEASTEAWLTANKDKDFLGLFARENVVVGDHTNSTWRSYVGSWLGHSLNKSEEDAGEDGIPNTWKGKDGIASTADDDVLEDDGTFTTQVYTTQDQTLGLIPPGKSVGDPIPGTGEDIDGDGQYDATLTLTDLDISSTLSSTQWGGNIPPGTVNYSSIASVTITKLEGVFYTNHAFAWLTIPWSDINVNGSIVSRNESIIYGAPGIYMNHDARLLGGTSGVAGALLPITVAPISVLSWRLLERDSQIVAP